jgi:rod shape determining protein RodA
MRIALILVIARFFNDYDAVNTTPLKRVLIPSLLVFFPILVTGLQPDLGTAILLLIGSVAVFFFAGISWKFFAFGLVAFLSSLPVLWFFLHAYQKNRILTFFNPGRDPLGSGYHIIQSQIAIGSGGFWGKGFMHGTQGALDFLPEKHTDFVFTLLSEEFGFIGVLLLIFLYCGFILFNVHLAFQTKNVFCRLTIVGLTVSFTMYAIINIAMVIGLLPVVGIPLPLVSYGGTSMVTLLISEGIIFSAAFYKVKVKKIDNFLR